jgi:4-hydroxy-2-oxoheptanedioate aldolase
MRRNRVRDLWRAGDAVINGWLGIDSAYSAELMAHQGFDSLTIDMQHGLIGYQTAVTMLQAISTTDTVPLARVPWNEPGVIMKMLDAGAYGIICPMINSRAEAEAFVGACRYPPAGYRSYGPKRVSLYAGADYPQRANDTVLTIGMIETAAAVENLDAILSTPGLDGIYIGPADLSQSFGGQERTDLTDPELVTILDKILAGAKRHGVAAGIHTGSPAYALQMIEKGIQFVTIQSDADFLVNETRRILEAMK